MQRIMLFCFISVAFFAAFPTYATTMASSQYQIKKDSLGSGGESSSDQYTSHDTTGEQAGGQSSGSTNSLNSGYFQSHPVAESSPTPTPVQTPVPATGSSSRVNGSSLAYESTATPAVLPLDHTSEPEIVNEKQNSLVAISAAGIGRKDSSVGENQAQTGSSIVPVSKSVFIKFLDAVSAKSILFIVITVLIVLVIVGVLIKSAIKTR